MNLYDTNFDSKFDELIKTCPDKYVDPDDRIFQLKYSIEFGALALAKQMVLATYREWLRLNDRDYKYPTGKNKDADYVSKWDPEFFKMCMANLRKPFEHLDHEMISETLVSHTIALALYNNLMVVPEDANDIEWREAHLHHIINSLENIEKLSRGRWGQYVSLETGATYAGIMRSSL